MSSDKTVRDGFLATVEQQVNSGDPPEVRATYDRLIAQGLSAPEATQMIAESRSFDNARFSQLLGKLPTLP